MDCVEIDVAKDKYDRFIFSLEEEIVPMCSPSP